MAGYLDELISTVRSNYEADLYLYIGDMDQPCDRLFNSWLTPKTRKRKNAILLMRTLGGSADVAYRIARRFQNTYKTIEQHDDGSTVRGKFYVCICRECKSAGTLLSIGANEIIMSTGAELGPLDVQLRKQDEVGERTSGLAPVQAMGSLRGQAIDHFKNIFLSLRFDSDLAFSTKLAAEVATKMTSSLLEPIYAQIDPIRMAEIERMLSIANAYGTRLTRSNNLREGALGKILAGYPSHGFVIDNEEAKTLFKTVHNPTTELEQLFDFFCSFTDENFYGKEKPFVLPILTDDERAEAKGERDGQDTPEADRGNTESSNEGDGTNNEDGDQ